MKCTVVGGRAAFEDLEEEWRVLHGICETRSPFATYAWYRAWLSQLGSFDEAQFFLGEEGGELRILLPVHGIGRSVTALRMSKLADYADVLISPSLSSEGFASFWSQLKTPLRSVRLSALIDSETKPLAMGAAAGGWKVATSPGHTNPYIDTRGVPFEEFLRTRSKSLRQELRTTRNRLGKGPEWEFYEAVSKEEWDETYEALVGFHLTRQESKAGDSVFADADKRSFFQSLRSDLGGESLTPVLHGIRWGGSICAASYSLRSRDRLFYWIPTFDASVRSVSLGKLLIELIVRQCVENGVTFDFMPGGERYKLQWANEAYKVKNFGAFSSSAQRTIWDFQHRAKRRLRSTVKGSRLLTWATRRLRRVR